MSATASAGLRRSPSRWGRWPCRPSLIGVLAGYDVLGLAAPLLLTPLRMVQGLSVGGEYTTCIVFLVERARPGTAAAMTFLVLLLFRRAPAA